MIVNLCTIAGSDPSGGAGIQADLKTFAALGAYGCAVIAALTAQSTRGVVAVEVPSAAFTATQVRTLRADVRIDAWKTGMLANAGVIAAVLDALAGDTAPLVVDPVMVSTSGHRLLDDDAVAAMRRLCARATIITPNRDELAVLCASAPASDADALIAQAQHLCRGGVRAVLAKGGHLAGGDCIDALVTATAVERFTAPRLALPRPTHGTGCTLSAALATFLGQGAALPEAARRAKAWLHAAIAAAPRLTVGGGAMPAWHGHGRNDQ